MLPYALENALSVLGEGPKKAVLFTLEEKYGLSIKSRTLTLESVTAAINDLFGPDGGHLLLEHMWLELEALAEDENKRHVTGPRSPVRELTPDQKFNSHISSVFIGFISEMLGPDVYTWIESKLRMQDTTLKNAYFDADKIAPVLWTAFSSAGGFLLSNLVRQVSVSLGIQPVAYRQDVSLKALLDDMKKRSGFN
jgi:hypothetical protein